MILKELVEFTRRVPSLPPPGYQPAFVTKVIQLNGDGTLRGLVALSGEKRGKREGKTIMAPRESPQRTVAIVPRLLCDDAEYVLGRAGEGRDASKVAARHTRFCELVRECAEVTGEPRVEAVVRWLDAGGPEGLREDGRIADDDEIAIEVDGVYPFHLDDVATFWCGRARVGPVMTCLVSGRRAPIVDRMPAPIKGIPEGQMSGTVLVGVNNPSGCSYGLDAAQNSPISADAALRICNGLNYLLSERKHSLRIARAVYVYWTREEQDYDLWGLLSQPDEAQVQELLRSPLRGRPAAEPAANDFFVLALSANASRIVVRDLMETTLEAVKASLAGWFRRLRIVDRDGQPTSAFGLFPLAASLYREARDMPAHVPTALLRSALQGSPLPDYLLGLALRRNQAAQGPYVEINGRRVLSVERLALVKALLQQKEVSNLEALNPQHPDPAYHCGRLLAAVERIQRAALGQDINATVVDRYYGSACASPGAVLGTLVNGAQAHLSKLRKEKRDYYHQLQLEDILSAIGPEFPRTLSLHRQGLFALGFYHQKAHDRAQAIAHRQDAQEEEGENQ